MMLAPILLFVYNRPQHTKKVIEALMLNSLAAESHLIIYSDNAKNDVVLQKVNEVRSYIKTIKGFKCVDVIFQTENKGLANSIVAGVTEMVNRYGKVIVLEDDLVTSPHFLSYMNKALDFYANEERVACIHGYVYPLVKSVPEVFFIKGADCWGWGTWKRAWDLYEPDGVKLLNELIYNGLEYEFNFDDSYPYIQMLKDQIEGKNDSWAIRWYASAFLKNKLTLYPGKSLVQNIGNDGSGVHNGPSRYFDINLADREPFVEGSVKESPDGYRAFKDYFEFLTKKGSKMKRIFRKINRIFRS